MIWPNADYRVTFRWILPSFGSLGGHMANQFKIPHKVELRLRQRFKVCAYCGCKLKAHIGVRGSPSDKATIEQQLLRFEPQIPQLSAGISRNSGRMICF